MVDGVQYIGRFLIIIGIVLSAIGGILLLSGKIPWLGRLPGDIIIQRKNFSFYFPLATSILLSVILTFIFWLIRRR
jgi:membrane protein implicated in regulation of membrane protease activity